MSFRKIGIKISQNNVKRENKTLSQYACSSTRGTRFIEENIPILPDIRPSFSHDTDRIINSKAFVRYKDKTQVFSFFENDDIQHRVLHVQLVSKIARSIGRSLKLNEDLIEAIALGHDLGHPPFGHDGERYLNWLCKKHHIGYFCHNAQSVRQLMEIEKNGKGLNLTLQVLDGILCHNGELLSGNYVPNRLKNWRQFTEEYCRCLSIEKYSKTLIPMTLEGCVVRLADLIAYIGRDLEDAIRLNVIDYSEIPKGPLEYFKINKDDEIHTKIIDTTIINLLEHSYGKDYLSMTKTHHRNLEVLKNFSSRKIYSHPVIVGEVSKTKGWFESLFKRYLKDFNNESSVIGKHVSKMSQGYISNAHKKRIVIDFIANMTDNFFLNECATIFMPKNLGYSLEKPTVVQTPPKYDKNRVQDFDTTKLRNINK